MGFNGIYYATRGGGDLLLLSHSFFLGDFWFLFVYMAFLLNLVWRI
jgi:hypothetical protein